MSKLKPPYKKTICKDCYGDITFIFTVEEIKVLKIFPVKQRYNIITCKNCDWSAKTKCENLDHIELEQILVEDNIVIPVNL